MDHAVSSHPGVRAQLDRLARLSPGRDVLGLERITRLLAKLGDPERTLPPVFHVAGTNGKGSTCAFLRAALEAAGHKVHVYTSPHLVRFNERIRLAGTLIEDAPLAALLAEVLDAAGTQEISFFEVTTAAAFLAFAREPADACVIEVGLGGRLDATNVIPNPLICGIAQLGMDHQQFLGDTLEQIASEKAGIAKPGVPLVTQRYASSIGGRIRQAAEAVGAPWLPRGKAWEVSASGGQLRYHDARGAVSLPLPRLAGAHQIANAGLAIAMLRHQPYFATSEAALREAMAQADWPARLQRLGPGPLLEMLPYGAELWLDGGHNPAAARAVADFVAAHVPDTRPLHLVLGLLANKDASGVLQVFRGRALTVHAVPVPGHEHHPPAALVALAGDTGLPATAAADVSAALGRIGHGADPACPPVVLILGSLYLAGEVLKTNEQMPA